MCGAVAPRLSRIPPPDDQATNGLQHPQPMRQYPCPRVSTCPKTQPEVLLVELVGPVADPRAVSFGSAPPVWRTAVPRTSDALLLLWPHLAPRSPDLSYPFRLGGGGSSDVRRARHSSGSGLSAKVPRHPDRSTGQRQKTKGATQRGAQRRHSHCGEGCKPESG